MDWQPSKTAPKDGTWIIAWVSPIPHIHDPQDGHPALAYWTTHNGGGWVWNGLAGNISHWQPLPVPPDKPVEADA